MSKWKLSLSAFSFGQIEVCTQIKVLQPPSVLFLPHLQNDQKVLYKKQFGFQKKFSTAHAVISLIENIEKAIDNKMFVCGVFVDLRKAFDTVDLNILLHKLSYYGIRDIANCWFSSYLSKQFVTINGFDSVIQSFQYGVPQGSVLGPLLF